MSDGKRACSTPGCILWSKHVTPCTTAEQLIRAMDDKEAVLAERDVLVARCKVLTEALTTARDALHKIGAFAADELNAEMERIADAACDTANEVLTSPTDDGAKEGT